MFPRFFFVSDPALLEILGQASDSHTVQNHLLSIFDNTRWIKFHDIEYNKMTAIVSSEGEVIQLEKAVRAEGSVETWLTQLLVTSQASLHSIIRQANNMINDPNFSLLQFLDKVPAQVRPRFQNFNFSSFKVDVMKKRKHFSGWAAGYSNDLDQRRRTCTGAGSSR